MKITHEWDLNNPEEKKEYEKTQELERSHALKDCLIQRLESKLKWIKQDITYVLQRENETVKLSTHILEALEHLNEICDK